MNAPPRVYLDAFLAPLAAYLGRSDVTDLYINRPGELWLETAAGTERHEAPALDDSSLWRLARQIAASSDQGINREHPLLAATLPDGARIQICAPPATRGHIIVAVRKHSMPDLRLSDYENAGAFDRLGEAALKRRATDDMLAILLGEGRTFEFLTAAVQARRTIVISGGTGTGKTTFLNALLKEAPDSERFVLIEDTPEIQLHHQNAVGLIAVRGKLGEASVSPADLVEAALRLRPDRIIMGEVRGAEAISWLRAVGTGHPGSITTVHANSPEGAIEQLALMSISAGTELGRAELVDYIKATVDVFVQLSQDDGTRLVTEIRFDGPDAAG
ncbi:MAG: P-type DNA transfer ATPase VirB11 [Sphingomonas sp.]|uniref:P-type DNA transfer ATPase VirB11 n=1 Tax=Sphingomonas sp. TaxID=28214 RepID=UPI0018434832|nr:P-type DNA transfer ATPase VirB11 [Sphingomonas sp.]MBA3667809.1 P-type DNA transfer ATPase VirB11 [Sphingomonas sp.]